MPKSTKLQKEQIAKELKKMYYGQRLAELNAINYIRTAGVLGVIISLSAIATAIVGAKTMTVCNLINFALVFILIMGSGAALYFYTNERYKQKSKELRAQRTAIKDLFKLSDDEYSE